MELDMALQAVSFTRPSALYFAEGFTGAGFQEWLTLYNPGGTDAQAELTYYTQEEGELPIRAVTVPANTRVNVYVNESAGPGYQLTCRVRVTSSPGIVAERTSGCSA